jgi:hypothetical protein
VTDEIKKDGVETGRLDSSEPNEAAKPEEKEPFKLQELYAFVSKNENGNEGIIGMPSPQGVIPMFTADKKNLPKLLEGARLFANAMDQSITVLKFSNREEYETIEPSMLIKPDMAVQRVKCSMSAAQSDDALKKH